VIADALVIVGGYLIGSIPFGVVLVRLFRREDIRAQGSGNIGASNVWRIYGKSLGIPVALLDVAKGFVPALVGLAVGGEWVGVLAGVAAMLGHARPVWLGFRKGGKMVATGGGVSFALAPVPALLCLVAWVVVFVLFRYASLASLLTSIALPLACVALGEPWPTVLFAALASAAVIFLHRQNIRRLLNGTEARFSRRASTSA
jgi:acyl phosphate:glycerol-3-phosphate acyltransferase